MRSHAYLLANLPLLAAVSLLLFRMRRSEYCRLALGSGVACLPCGLLAAMHNGEYWSPVRLGGFPIGIEDFIFTFTAGAAAWLAAAGPHRRRIVAGSGLDRRVLLWGAVSAACGWALWRVGFDCMTSTLAAAGGLLLLLVARRIRLWPLALTGVAVFVPFYVAVVRIQFAFWPDYVLAWNQAGPWAARIWGIPAGEIAWAVSFAALWPMVVASALNVEVKPPQAP
ncbi:MAG: hypothetical protein HY822_02625 [Acidobacteria bacterium]|nr:hypothetical protein [Acidobacteriota bacterium]